MKESTSVSKFLNEEVVDFASYSTLRAIASCIDGLKNSHRKVVHYMQNNGQKEKKLFNLSGEIMTSTEYLHGDISGSIITLAQDYIGTNNIPLLSREGNFGSRFTPEASAVRYIYTQNESYFGDIFKKDDNSILVEQYFEGSKIEPRFFVPTIPLLLVNGSEGIATGFAQKILPRDPKILIKYIKNKLEGKKVPELMPYYKGFKGTIKKTGELNQYEIIGSLKIKNATTIEIDEIPVGYNLKSYTKVLDALEDNKTIRSYKDKSEDDIFNFEVKVDSGFTKQDERKILDKLKLIKKVTENFTVIDENNRVKSYTSTDEIMEHYIRIKLDYVGLRRGHLISELMKDIKLDASKYYFIKGIVEEEIIVNKTKKENIIKQLEKIKNIIEFEGNYDYLLRMPIYSLTEEKMKDLLEKIKDQKRELEKIKSTSIESIWIEDIKNLKIS